MPRIDAILEAVQAQGASDLHIATGAPPMIRRNGDMQPIQYQELTAELAEMLLFEMMGERERRIFEETRDVDFSYEIPGKFRVRCNVYDENRGLAGAFRLLPSSILTLEQLGLPPHIAELGNAAKGLILVTGPPGSGKSTTLAAMIDWINNRMRRHIITIEDPIEYVHQNRQCLVNQREVGKHTPTFSSALRAALREDPDVILVGEIRDFESMHLALTAAQTGQLVLGTLHTISAAETVERIVDTFPADQQSQARGALAMSLKAVIAQRLLRRADDKGRIAAVEVLLGNPAVSSLIREKKHHQIPSVMQTGRREGMQTLDESLRGLVTSGLVAVEEAQRYTNTKLAAPARTGEPIDSPARSPEGARPSARPGTTRTP
ncbi:MAG: type IV pilus twitching motility protein PilT [Gemmatimonadetes bacterium]|nr:type IV pilus twitching motility protein PilT [Gemmatimonadota bacterium]